MAIGDAGLKFLLQADGSQAVKAINDLRARISTQTAGITSDFAGMGSRALAVGSSITSSLSPVTAGLSAVVGVVGGAVVGILSLAQTAAAAGSRFNDLSIKTGLSVETLSGLNLQARQSGTSIEALSAGVFMLQKNMAGASPEVLKLAASMGITAENVNDSDATLRRLFEGLAKIPDEAQRNAAGARLMGRQYQELAVLVKDLNGDIDGAIEKAREMGLVMSKEASQGADRLGDELDALSLRGQGLAVMVGSAIVPEITRAIEDIGAALNFNKSTWKEWHDYIAEMAARTRATIDGLAAEMRALFSLEGWSSPGNVGRMGDKAAEDSYRESQKRRGLVFDLNDPKSYYQPPPGETAADMLRKIRGGDRSSGGRGGGGRGGRGGGGSNSAQQLEARNLTLFNKELESVTRTNREVLEREYELSLRGRESYFKQANEDNEEHYENQQRALNKEEEIARKFIKNAKELEIKLREIQLDRDNAKDARDKEARRLEDEEKRQAAAATLALERQLADTQESVRAGLLERLEAQAEAGIIKQSELEQRRHDLQQEAFNDQKILLELELNAFGTAAARRIEIGNALIKNEQDRANAAEAASRRIIGAMQAEQSVVLPDPSGLKEAEANAGKAPIQNPDDPEFGLPITEQMTVIGAFKDFAMSAFAGVAQGFGGMIQAFLNGGQLSGKAFLSLAKSVAAGLAAQSLVEAAMQVAHAIKEKALAAASLAAGDVKGAALHTLAAAGHIAAAKAFGVVGAVAAVAALALPGGGGGAGGGAGGGNGEDERDRVRYREFKYGGGDGFASSMVAGEGSRNFWIKDMHEAIQRQTLVQAETNAQLARIRSMPHGEALAIGADENPRAVGRAVLETQRGDHEFTMEFLTNAGFGRA